MYLNFEDEGKCEDDCAYGAVVISIGSAEGFLVFSEKRGTMGIHWPRSNGYVYFCIAEMRNQCLTLGRI